MTVDFSSYSDSHLVIEAHHTDAVAVVTLSGEVDTINCARLRQAATDLLSQNRPGEIVLDMSAVTFLDSAGVRTLLTCREDALRAGRRFTLRQPHEHVRQVLVICGIEDMFD
jgi:anti-anti-sigma factor